MTDLFRKPDSNFSFLSFVNLRSGDFAALIWLLLRAAFGLRRNKAKTSSKKVPTSSAQQDPDAMRNARATASRRDVAIDFTTERCATELLFSGDGRPSTTTRRSGGRNTLPSGQPRQAHSRGRQASKCVDCGRGWLRKDRRSWVALKRTPHSETFAESPVLSSG